MYLTPTRYKTLGLGSDLTGITDAEIAAAIRRSVSRIHGYCCVPRLPSPFSFRGGSVTNEEHSWVPDEYEQPAPFRVFPLYQPVVSVESFRIYITNDVFTEFPGASLVINNEEGYLEVSTFQQTIFSAGLTPLVGLMTPISKTSYTYGQTFVVVDEPAVAISTTVYQADSQYWTAATVTVKKNGVVVPSGYTISRTEGRITFGAAQSASDEITISYSHSLDPDIAAGCGILTAQDIAESDLRKKGMAGLDSIRVKDVELRRFGGKSTSHSSNDSLSLALPPEALSYLSGHVFYTLRGT